MSYPYNQGHQHGQNGGSLPQQGNTPAQTYKDFAAGWHHAQNGKK